MLGAIVSPTDPVAATAIARRLGAPRRVVTIVEGESLVNDATALIAYKFAVAAVRDRQLLACWTRALDFVAQRGRRHRDRARGRLDRDRACAAGSTTRRPRSRSRSSPPTSPTCRPRRSTCRACSPPSPSASTWAGMRRGSSRRRRRACRAFAVWEILVFVLNAALFVLLGLQLPQRPRRRSTATRAGELIGYGAIVSARGDRDPHLWVFPLHLPAAVPVPARPRARPHPPWQHPLLVAWTRHARRRVARGRARDPAPDRRRRARSRTAT